MLSARRQLDDILFATPDVWRPTCKGWLVEVQVSVHEVDEIGLPVTIVLQSSIADEMVAHLTVLYAGCRQSWLTFSIPSRVLHAAQYGSSGSEDRSLFAPAVKQVFGAATQRPNGAAALVFGINDRRHAPVALALAMPQSRL